MCFTLSSPSVLIPLPCNVVGKKFQRVNLLYIWAFQNLGQISLVAFIGPIKENFNWEITLFAFALILGLAWLVLQFLNIDTHKESVAALNKKDVENESLKVA